LLFSINIMSVICYMSIHRCNNTSSICVTGIHHLPIHYSFWKFPIRLKFKIFSFIILMAFFCFNLNNILNWANRDSIIKITSFIKNFQFFLNIFRHFHFFLSEFISNNFTIFQVPRARIVFLTNFLVNITSWFEIVSIK
jgi:hypothetical protein